MSLSTLRKMIDPHWLSVGFEKVDKSFHTSSLQPPARSMSYVS